MLADVLLAALCVGWTMQVINLLTPQEPSKKGTSPLRRAGKSKKRK